MLSAIVNFSLFVSIYCLFVCCEQAKAKRERERERKKKSWKICNENKIEGMDSQTTEDARNGKKKSNRKNVDKLIIIKLKKKNHGVFRK